jgi:hypothetical protein
MVRSTGVVLLLAALGCASAAPRAGIRQERAIEIASAEVKWKPFDVAARPATSNGRQIWRVTLKGRLPGQPPLLFETVSVSKT